MVYHPQFNRCDIRNNKPRDTKHVHRIRRSLYYKTTPLDIPSHPSFPNRKTRRTQHMAVQKNTEMGDRKNTTHLIVEYDLALYIAAPAVVMDMELGHLPIRLVL